MWQPAVVRLCEASVVRKCSEFVQFQLCSSKTMSIVRKNTTKPVFATKYMQHKILNTWLYSDSTRPACAELEHETNSSHVQLWMSCKKEVRPVSWSKHGPAVLLLWFKYEEERMQLFQVGEQSCCCAIRAFVRRDTFVSKTVFINAVDRWKETICYTVIKSCKTSKYVSHFGSAFLQVKHLTLLLPLKSYLVN